MSEQTREQLLDDVSQRVKVMEDTVTGDLAALKEQMEPEKLRAFVAEYLGELDDADPIVRKMRFGSKTETAVVGSKFSRWGLNTADIEMAYDIMSATSRGPSEELTKAFNAVSEAYFLSDDAVKEIDRRAIDELYPRVPKAQVRGLTREQWVEGQMRAMDTAESGYGQQLIGAQYVGDLWDVSRDLGVIAPLIRSFEMTAPTAYLPVEAGFPEMFILPESTENNSAAFATTKTPSQRVSVTAMKFGIHQMWSGEMEEDAIIPYIPFLRQQAARSLAFYQDSAVLNGDTTNSASNINDSSDPADTKHFLNYDGLRHAALVDNTANLLNVGGVVTLDTFRALRALMRDDTRKVDWGHPVSRDDLVFIADPDTADRIDLIDDVVNSKLMAGNGQDLLNGQTAVILGHPVIRTMAQSKALATGFIHNSAGNDYGQLTAFNRTGCVLGWRRRLKVETQRLPETDQSRIVYTLRNGFGRFTPTGAASGIEWVASARNITV